MKATSSKMSYQQSQSSSFSSASSSTPTSSPVVCRICLNISFESDESKLDRLLLRPLSVSRAVTSEWLAEMVSPCHCIGSVGRMHKGCLLLEVQYRRSSQCQLCRSKYRFVEVQRTRSNSIGSYLATHWMRALVTLFYFVCIPVLTTLWFCNKLRITEQLEEAAGGGSSRVRRFRGGVWNLSYRRTMLTPTPQPLAPKKQQLQGNKE